MSYTGKENYIPGRANNLRGKTLPVSNLYEQNCNYRPHHYNLLQYPRDVTRTNNLNENKTRIQIKQEPLTDVLGNQYIVSPGKDYFNMEGKRRKPGDSYSKIHSIIKKEIPNKHEIRIKQEPQDIFVKQEPTEDMEIPSTSGNSKERKRKIVKPSSSVKVKKRKSSIVEKIKSEREEIFIKQEPTENMESSSLTPGNIKERKRKIVKSSSSVKVKKRKSSIDDNIMSDTSDPDLPRKKTIKKREVKSKPGTSKEGEKIDCKFDIKTEKDIALLNKVFQADLRKKKQCFILSELLKISFDLTAKIMGLFDSDATIPFIVRYRQHIIQNLTAEELRNFKHNYDYLDKVFDKAETLKRKLEALGHLDDALSNAIDSCTSIQELDYIYEPYKVTKSSKLMKVIDSGLIGPATAVLNGSGIVNIEGIQTPENLKESDIIDLIIYYIGETMSKDTELLKKVQEIKKTERIMLTCKQKKETASKKANDQKKKSNRPEDNYFNYYNFSQRVDRVKPYQVLAINRGEKEQCLQVSLVIEDSFRGKLSRFAFGKWYNKGKYYDLRKNIFNKAVDFMFNQRVAPHLKRVIRSELTKEGEKASLEVFSSNLKYLLLTPPIHNVTVCAIDPGFSNGCKIAVLNAKQEVLITDILYLNDPRHFAYSDCKLVKLMIDFNVDLLAVGNGKGCRDVEACLSKLVNSNLLNKDFRYIVVNERGVSVYSCSPEAIEDYPNYSPNVISAISLAKRVLDPLCEMVKVDPKHLGVGMYQHDISEKKLETELNEVVSECVSNVGVDINNAPLRILKRVAGLTDSRAKAIIETREKKGSFINRDELKKVKGIGPKTFQQCAGFIKIIPGTIILKNEKTKMNTNHFDQTIVHPEDYGSAKKLLAMNGLKADHIGNTQFIDKLTSFMRSKDLSSVAKEIGAPIETIKLILEALTKPVDYDIRSKLDKPIFRTGAKSIHDLQSNTILSGQVENVTHFGAFVDIGIECCGLIPTIFCQGKTLHLGQKVTVRVGEIDSRKMRVSLHLVKIDSSEE